ncbi:hypothetical protein MSR1_28360 [Magnetospirillum gryphiswaldense MSR-1]|nr:hypothetical protein MSR1_28360 [Magnetospirillum gryphiswaldense MSR-1]AVM79207.1 hypothetical protein MSR1L_28360 [Magnetospirillum gryphiswaldense]
MPQSPHPFKSGGKSARTRTISHGCNKESIVMSVLVPVSWGEVIDKITILEIKAERLSDAGKLANVTRELDELVSVREREFPNHADLAKLAAELKAINEKLWVVEDDLRDLERAKDFGPRFVELARAVYYTNDERAAVKRKVNDLLGSTLVEEKSYAPYA